MSEQTESHDEFNRVDPDILAYYEESGELELLEEHRSLEKEFHDFFKFEWQSPDYDDLREGWESLITDEDPRIRVLGKTALWSVIRLRKGREQGIYRPIIPLSQAQDRLNEVG